MDQRSFYLEDSCRRAILDNFSTGKGKFEAEVLAGVGFWVRALKLSEWKSGEKRSQEADKDVHTACAEGLG